MSVMSTPRAAADAGVDHHAHTQDGEEGAGD
jgi:hypothetical protein